MSSKKNNYRVTFILDLRETDEAPETVIENMKSEIVAIDGEIGEVNDMGQKDFARVTDVKRPTGHYVQIEFAGPANANVALQERLHLNKVAYRIFVEAI